MEKVVNSGEIIMDRTYPGAPEDQSKVVQAIISSLSKDSAIDNILRMVAIHKHACCCLRVPSKSMTKMIIGVMQDTSDGKDVPSGYVKYHLDENNTAKHRLTSRISESAL